MTSRELLTYLERLDVSLWADHDRLRYNAPSGVMTTELQAELKRHKDEILSMVSNGDETKRLTSLALLPVPRQGEHSASFSQSRLWFIDRLSPQNTAYNSGNALRLTGRLNVGALEASLNEIVRRHEALRTTFVQVDESVLQLVAPHSKIELPVIDIGEHTRLPERETVAERLVTEEVKNPFDLERGPLFRFKLFRLSDDDHILVLTMHHIITDGWSWTVLFRELTALYKAFSFDQPSPLPELPIQYIDYAHWQRAWLQGKTLDTHRSYWKRELDGVPALLDLPTDRPRPAVQSYRGASQSVRVSKALAEQLSILSRREGVTLFMTLLAAFQVLLFRWSRQDDIVVGSPIAGRNRVETEGAIGLFLNTLVLRTDLSGDPSFRELLQRVREVALGAYAHQEIPFEKLLGELGLERSLSYSPLFQVMFVLQNLPDVSFQLPDLTVKHSRPKTSTAMFDLVLSLHEGPNGIHGELFYKTDLFESATIQRMTTHFLALLEGVVANPEQTVSALPLLTEGERRQLLVEWNDTEKASPRDKWVHQLFEEQAERTPGAVAVLAPLPSQSNGESAGSLPIGNEELTYRELNTRANQLAHYLKKRGVGPEALVGICVERSLEMITGILGVLKAGAAYVPLDPNYPAERLAHIFDDARMRLVLTQKRLTESFSQFGLEVLWLDSEWEKICREPGENPSVQVTAENLAYVIYTSGSTGKPKGVGVAHRPLANYTQVASELFALSSNDRVLQFASISFDTSVEEIFPCLTRGATLVLRTDAMLDGAASFLETCNEWGVNVVDLPTAYWHELIDPMVREGLTLPGCLRLMIIGGERAVPSQLMNWHRAVGDRAQLLNTYGPTEATVAATVWELNGTVSENESLREVPLGRPIANAQIYILDSHLQPVPIGVAGDLYIGGAGLARGYLNHSDQTADKFIPNPFSHRPGERLYRTGDLGRYLSDGDIEFLGRIDHQVKVRGYRIELGEIEAVLSCHPQVRHAVVLAREDASGEHSTTPRVNKRLVAYVVAAQAPAPSPSDLRSFLQATLPEYMIPSVFVFLDSLPLTSRGKVDRRVLPEPDQSSPELECDFVAPRTPIEKSMAEIWREVLKLERIGVKDNFFSLGGHSLLAMQVVYRVEKQFRLEVPLRVLFKNPTLEQLARFVHDRCAANEYGENVEGILSEIEALSDDAAWSLLGDKNRLGQA